MELLSYGDSIPEGDYRLHSAFAGALNFRKGRVIVSLVLPRAGAGPHNLVLKRLPAGAARLRASRSCFYVDEARLRKAPETLYSSAIPRLRASPEAVRANVSVLTGILIRRSPPKSLAFIFAPALEAGFSGVFEKHLLARFKKAVAHFNAGDYARGVRTMRGLGTGLTPSGDDFICGLLAGFNFALRNLRVDAGPGVEEIFRRAEGGNPISNAFLRASYEGKVSAKVRRLLEALAGRDSGELAAAGAAALASGHTSGADLCSGLVFALRAALK